MVSVQRPSFYRRGIPAALVWSRSTFLLFLAVHGKWICIIDTNGTVVLLKMPSIPAVSILYPQEDRFWPLYKYVVLFSFSPVSI